MAFVGLVPSEHSSGTTRARGAITKTGNAHLRRVLVEAAWHYRHHPFVGAPPPATAAGRARAGDCAGLGGSNNAYIAGINGCAARGKPETTRGHGRRPELTGFVWAALTQ